MREIKFRAWDYNSIRYDVTGLECGANGTIGDWYSGVYLDGDYFSLNGDATRTTKAILMQFTGLLDKNGKDVYEGDIVTHNTSIFGDTVVWYGGAFRLGSGECTHTLLNRLYSCVVIGNIYENPELVQP